jgi:hypothetical protein
MAYYDGFLVLLAITAALALAIRQPAARAAPRAWMEAAVQPKPVSPIGAAVPAGGVPLRSTPFILRGADGCPSL